MAARRRGPPRLRPLAAALLLVAVGMAAWAPVPLAPPAAAGPVAAAGPPAPASPAAAASPRPAAGPPARQRAGGSRVPPLRLPVEGPVVRGFEPPSGPYGPGHRGVDLAAALGTPVLAPASGRVLFAGQVAGLGWVSVEVAPGVVVAVGPLDRPAVRAGGAVPALARLGRLGPGHGGRAHLGLRVDGAYVDPLPFLVGFGPPRLAPLPAPAAR